MSKDHEQFLLKCELVKTMLMRVWTKGLITDDEMKNRVEKLKDEESKKNIEK